MTNKQESKQKSANAVEEELTAGADTWKDSKAFSAGVAAFRILHGSTTVFGQIQLAKGKGASKGKRSARDAAIKSGLQLSANIQAYAADVDNVVLETVMHFTLSGLRHLGDVELLDTLNLICNTADSLGDKLADYEVSAGSLAQVKSLTVAFSAKMSAPRSAQVDGSVATGKLSDIFAAMDKALLKLDRLVGNFEGVNAAFVAKYRAARAVVARGVRHRAAAGQKTA